MKDRKERETAWIEALRYAVMNHTYGKLAAKLVDLEESVEAAKQATSTQPDPQDTIRPNTISDMVTSTFFVDDTED